MSSSDEITAVEQDGLSDGESDNPESHSEPTTTLEGFTPSTGDEWPAGTTLPLNSKRLNLHKWRAIAASLELSTDATLSETRLIVEGKLTELGHEPIGVQVVLSDGEDSVMYLVDEGGIIERVDMTAHVTRDESREPGASERSALRDSSELERLRSLVSEHETVIDGLRGELRTATETISELQIASANAERLTGEVASLTAAVQTEKLKVKRFWRLRCEQMLREEDLIQAKDAEIAELREQLRMRAASPRPTTDTSVPERSTPSVHEPVVTTSPLPSVRRGKAPPVEAFTGDNAAVHWDDWLPTLKRAATWNNWSEQEQLIQLAGHLRGKAQREWDLMAESSKISFSAAVETLRTRLDSGSRAVAAQDFRHLSQQTAESVADFICRLEKTFRRAYGHEQMSEETKNTLLYGQLNEGLKYSLIKAPAVSGASEYKQLCVAARNEERRQNELMKRQQYQQADHRPSRSDRFERSSKKPTGNDLKDKMENTPNAGRGTSNQRSQIKCWNCKKMGHQAKDCRLPKRESIGTSGTAPGTKMIQSDTRDDPLQYLFSDSEEEESRVGVIRVTDHGSKCQSAKVVVGGVPLYGIVDSGADITIMGGTAFKQVATVAKLRKRDFKPPDKIPKNYDLKPFHVDGMIDVDIEFQGKTMNTPVYVKMDAPEELLLSEGVCRQLNIINYHPEVQSSTSAKRTKLPDHVREEGVTVPTVRICLVQPDIRLTPNECVTAQVQIDGDVAMQMQPLLAEGDKALIEKRGLQMVDVVLSSNKDDMLLVSFVNHLGITQKLEKGMEVGRAQPVDVIKEIDKEVSYCFREESTTSVKAIELETKTSLLMDEAERKVKLKECLSNGFTGSNLTTREHQQVLSFLETFNDVFSLSDSDRGETDLIEMTIETGDAVPKKQAVRRTPFAVRHEIAIQLQRMLEQRVIQPSSSPWASPIVLVRKKDGSLRFCVDYRSLNSVTKPDSFPLPRIDDMLDQLGNMKYFSTLDLASGYWQVKMSNISKEKTAFVTQHGLFEFCVMPFGLTNAPAVFQRLMHQVISTLNPMKGPSFVSVYIDDLLVYSRTLEEHLNHLSKVMNRLREVNLKLQPAKCYFCKQTVEFLGHVLTPRGLLPNPKRVTAVQNFPVPCNVTELRQFLGLASYYRRFVAQFAKIAAPLHRLTGKDVRWEWSKGCETAFHELKQRLLDSPILVYPDFDLDFVLETDASKDGLGAILSQKKADDKLHPVAYASRSTSPAEKHYSVTELETLAVVWAVQHFRAYLYGHNVTVITDHSAVKSILDKPSSNGKHARWWLKIFGSGVGKLKIIHRPGRENIGADALSRNAVCDCSSGTDLDEFVLHVCSEEKTNDNVTDLLTTPPLPSIPDNSLYQEQRKDPKLAVLIEYLENGTLPKEEKEARKTAALATKFVILDKVLYFIDQKKTGRRRAAVPKHLQEKLLQEYHGGRMAGHFSGNRLYATLCYNWWWENMYVDAITFCRNCAECAMATGTGREKRPPLHPIPVKRPFQIWGIDIMELPKTAKGNKYVIVMQDFLTKWPLVVPAPDQKANRIARLLVDELLPMFGVPEALLSDRGTNLLANVVQDVCQLLGITKLNTTAYHPQCDGMVERLNRTLKSMLRKHAMKFGNQWDRYLSGVLWAYRNTPHEATKEKPSYLLFGTDCRFPTEAAFLPIEPIEYTDVEEYKEEVTLSLSSARELAASNIRTAQKRYKEQYDKRATPSSFKVGDLVLVRFPQEESGRQRKLSRPWHGPYRVVQSTEPDVTVVKQYFPEEGTIQVHQLRVRPCPQLPIGYYWYGGKRHSSGKVPEWVNKLLSANSSNDFPDGIENEELISADDVRDNPEECNNDSEVDVENERWTNADDVKDSSEKHSDDLEDDRNRGQGYSLRDRATRKPPARFKMIKFGTNYPSGEGVM